MKLTFENSFPITAVDYLLTVMNQSGYVGIWFWLFSQCEPYSVIYHLGPHRAQAENSWFKPYSEQHFLWCDSAMKLCSAWQSLCIHHICPSRAIRQLTVPEQAIYCTREDGLGHFLKEPRYHLCKRVVCIGSLVESKPKWCHPQQEYLRRGLYGGLCLRSHLRLGQLS